MDIQVNYWFLSVNRSCKKLSWLVSLLKFSSFSTEREIPGVAIYLSISDGPSPFKIFFWKKRAASSFYHYFGSLTTGGHNKAVTWTVFENPIILSEKNKSDFNWNLTELTIIVTIIGTLMITDGHVPLPKWCERSKDTTWWKNCYSFIALIISCFILADGVAYARSHGLSFLWPCEKEAYATPSVEIKQLIWMVCMGRNFHRTPDGYINWAKLKAKFIIPSIFVNVTYWIGSFARISFFLHIRL